MLYRDPASAPLFYAVLASDMEPSLEAPLTVAVVPAALQQLQKYLISVYKFRRHSYDEAYRGFDAIDQNLRSTARLKELAQFFKARIVFWSIQTIKVQGQRLKPQYQLDAQELKNLNQQIDTANLLLRRLNTSRRPIVDWVRHYLNDASAQLIQKNLQSDLKRYIDDLDHLDDIVPPPIATNASDSHNQAVQDEREPTPLKKAASQETDVTIMNGPEEILPRPTR